MVNKQAKFIEMLAEKTEPLRSLLQQHSQWIWGPQQQSAFELIKREITQAPVIAMFDVGRNSILSADASLFGLGAVFKQKQPSGEYKAVASASKSLTETERRYAQIEKERPSVTWATEKFQTYLLGSDFTILTDHKHLVPLLGTKSLCDLPPRIHRFHMRLLQFSYKICHIPAKNLIVAEALSTQPTSTPDKVDEVFQDKIECHKSAFSNTLSASEKKLQEIKTLQDKDILIAKVRVRIGKLAKTAHSARRTLLEPQR